VVVHGSPYFFHAGFGVYFGGVSLSFQIGNVPPAGYAWFDPICNEVFWSLPAYRAHVAHHCHQPVLHAVWLGDVACGY
jgi:hypothetical protein